MQAPQSSLNGYFERVRRVFRLVGVSDVPTGLQPVVIAADTREPGAASSSYRRFAFSGDLSTSIPAALLWKLKFASDCVITDVESSWNTAAANSMDFFGMTASAVAADGAATYVAPNTNRAAWVENLEAGPPPFTVAQNGIASPAGGRLLLRHGANARPWAASTGLGWYFEAGEALLINLPVLATLHVFNVRGYQLRN